MSAVAEIVFQVEPCAETGGYVARWDAPHGCGGITTQGDSFAELDAMIADAVSGYFEPKQRPRRIRLHFSQDPILAVA
jgi:predicted RNase H-like HicB family nuclease